MNRIRRILAIVPLIALALLLMQMPLEPALHLSPLLRIDALSGVMLVALCIGLAVGWGALEAPVLRTAVLAVALALAYLALDLPLLAAGLGLAAIVTARRGRLRWSLAPLPALFLGLAWLWYQAGSWSLIDPTLPAALDSLSFGLVLLAAFLGLDLLPLLSSRRADVAWSLLLRPAWIYPLARLYELETWQAGWILATVLLGGAAALWFGWSAPWADTDEARMARVESSLLGAALASLGLVTEAGLAGALVGVIAAVVAISGIALRRRHPLLWLVAGPVPLTLPFVAIWLQLSAAVAANLPLLAVALWLSSIGWAVAALRRLSAGATEPAGWTLRLLALVSLLAGISSPLLLNLLVQPALVQLGAGITPYGRPVVWPWLGLEVRNAGGGTVSSWLAVAIAGLLVLLAAIAYLALRVLELRAREAPARPGSGGAVPAALWNVVRRSVPWLPPGGAGHDD